jgi:Leucine-rich repeat (LRR) protein
MITSDSDVIKKLIEKVGSPFSFKMDNERCVELALTCDSYRYHGLIRHHTVSEKQEIMLLVSQLTALKKLDLRRNVLNTLPQNFINLNQLEWLNLGSNYLGPNLSLISGFRSLTHLHLGNNDIVEIPSFIGDMQKLEYLALHKNIKIRVLNDAISNLKSLRTLNLYFVLIKTLPDFVYRLRSLTSLSLYNITNLSDDLAKLDNLEFFTHLGGLKMRALPDGFVGLKRLKMARLYQNSLRQLPADFGNLKNLEQLSLYQNELSTLPDSFVLLSNLKKLNLGWNQFEALPDYLRRMDCLEWLGIFENPLRYPDLVPVQPKVRVTREWPFSTMGTLG